MRRPRKLRLHIDIIETADDMAVHFSTNSRHLPHCPTCLAAFAERLAAAFQGAIEHAETAQGERAPEGVALH
jgi:hypothetical protein